MADFGYCKPDSFVDCCFDVKLNYLLAIQIQSKKPVSHFTIYNKLSTFQSSRYCSSKRLKKIFTLLSK